jgi:hypothetical protein
MHIVACSVLEAIFRIGENLRLDLHKFTTVSENWT